MEKSTQAAWDEHRPAWDAPGTGAESLAAATGFVFFARFRAFRGPNALPLVSALTLLQARLHGLSARVPPLLG